MNTSLKQCIDEYTRQIKITNLERSIMEGDVDYNLEYAFTRVPQKEQKNYRCLFEYKLCNLNSCVTDNKGNYYCYVHGVIHMMEKWTN